MEYHFGKPAKLNFSESIPKLIGKMLTSNRNTHFLDSAVKNTKYPDCFELLITERMRRQTGHLLSPTQVTELNTIISDLFYSDLFKELNASLRADPDFVIKYGILELCQEMGVTEDEVPLATISKRYQRYRKANGGTIKTKWARRIAQNAQKMSYKNVA